MSDFEPGEIVEVREVVSVGTAPVFEKVARARVVKKMERADEADPEFYEIEYLEGDLKGQHGARLPAVMRFVSAIELLADLVRVAGDGTE